MSGVDVLTQISSNLITIHVEEEIKKSLFFSVNFLFIFCFDIAVCFNLEGIR